MVKELLFWEKYAPTNMEEAIVLPRIQNIIKDGIQVNLMFEGPSGCGKSSLAKLLTSGKNCKKIDVSKNSGVDTLREDIYEFCNTQSIFDDNTGFKYVYLEEFDRVSAAFQDALRGFIEEYQDKVRFVAIVNNVAKISDPIQSRFNIIKFTPSNDDERKFIMNAMYKRCQHICEKEAINITKEDLVKIIKKNSPDMRRTLNNLQLIKITGNVNVLSGAAASNTELYNLVISTGTASTDHDYLMANYVDTPEEALVSLGRPFYEWANKEKPEMISKWPMVLPIWNKYMSYYSTTLDPIILLMGLVSELRTVLKK